MNTVPQDVRTRRVVRAPPSELSPNIVRGLRADSLSTIEGGEGGCRPEVTSRVFALYNVEEKVHAWSRRGCGQG